MVGGVFIYIVSKQNNSYIALLKQYKDGKRYKCKCRLKLDKMKNWDCNKNDYVETSKELKRFFEDIENVCKKHGYSISHEDGHGAFEIEKYSDDNIDWIKNANLRLNGA